MKLKLELLEVRKRRLGGLQGELQEGLQVGGQGGLQGNRENSREDSRNAREEVREDSTEESREKPGGNQNVVNSNESEESGSRSGNDFISAE